VAVSIEDTKPGGWLRRFSLLAVYAILGLAFFLAPMPPS
jgi:hypothetical protein